MPLWDWPTIVLICARAVILSGVCVAAMFCAATVVANRHRYPKPTRQRGAARPAHTAPEPESVRPPLPAGVLDIEAEARWALGRVGELAAQHFVKLELAMPAGMTANTDRSVLREVLHDLLVHAICHGPVRRVLLGAYQDGGQLHISVTDDGRGTELTAQRAALLPVERLAAGLGAAALDIEVWPGQGTTVVLRLPIPGMGLRAKPTINSPGGIWTPGQTPRPANATTRVAPNA